MSCKVIHIDGVTHREMWCTACSIKYSHSLLLLVEDSNPSHHDSWLDSSQASAYCFFPQEAAHFTQSNYSPRS